MLAITTVSCQVIFLGKLGSFYATVTRNVKSIIFAFSVV